MNAMRAGDRDAPAASLLDRPVLPAWVWRRASARALKCAATDSTRALGDTKSLLAYRTGVAGPAVAGDVHGGWIMKLCDDEPLAT